jgi:preprotein translocase subunit SecG
MYYNKLLLVLFIACCLVAFILMTKAQAAGW